jgi:phage tail sheath gpL-like
MCDINKLLGMGSDISPAARDAEPAKKSGADVKDVSIPDPSALTPDTGKVQIGTARKRKGVPGLYI